MENKKRVVKNNHLNEIMYRVNYRVNESPRYHPIIDSSDEFDKLPVEIYNTDDGQPIPTSQSFTNEAGEQEDAQQIGSKNPLDTDPSTEEPRLNAPPAGGEPTGTPPPPATPADPMNAPPTDMPTDMPSDELNPMGASVPTTPPVDDIQNDIIKHNVAAMQAIHDQLETLNGYVQGLDDKMKLLSSDVEEVREPTNVEKLMNKTQVSYPYYFNLNDMWGDNWFNQKRKEENEHGIKELPDGTYVADFDDLPKQSTIDIEKSFNELV